MIIIFNLETPFSLPPSFFFSLLFSLFTFETESGYVAQDDIKLMILLPQSPKHWNYKYVPPLLALILISYKFLRKIFL
jgi:hypothetical protein